MDTIRVFIADDHQIIIDGLSLLLNNEPNVEVIGSSNDGKQAYEQIIENSPSIAILDIKMPELSGLDILKMLQADKSTTKVILLTMHHDAQYMKEAFNNGAYSYLFKNASKSELINTLKMVHSGMKVFSDIKEEGIVVNNAAFFSKREKEVIALMVEGLTTKEIADKLSISHYTIDSHRKNINRKTNCSNIPQLINWLKENKID